MATTKRAFAVPANITVDEVRKMLHAAINGLQRLTSKDGNTYFGVPPGTNAVVLGVDGRVNLAWNGLRDAAQAAAATAERLPQQLRPEVVSAMTDEQRKAMIAQLSKGLK